MKLHIAVAGLFTLAALFPQAARSQQAGKFDYYLLNLSWSPEYCYSHRGSPECREHLGLIVHGLWPQYNGQGAGPENCGGEPGPTNPSTLLDILPTTALVQHEWATHGTCSGLSADDYFGLIRRLFTSFQVPIQLQHPGKAFIIGTADLKRAIEQANPGLNDTEIALTCTGNYLKEVEVCFNKEGKPQPCSGLRVCRSNRVNVPAIR